MVQNRTSELYETAKKYLVGGVCSSTRLNQAYGHPFFAQHGEGAWVWDVEEKKYLDFCNSHGASLLGHNHPSVRKAIEKAIQMGILCSFETEYHATLAKAITELIPCAELVRFTNSGTEATMHALRACRAYTGKSKVIRFEGHFHGYHDYLHIGGFPLSTELDRNMTNPVLESEGIPCEMGNYVISIPFNDPDLFRKTIRKYKDEVCCVILEPVNYNCACILPVEGYLKLLREETQKNGILLFFDEIQDAFKKVPGGPQEYFGVIPDMTCIGKSLGGGLPLSAFAGKREIMECIKPVGKTEHSGTFNAPLISILAGLAFIQEIRKPGFYRHLESIEKRLYPGMNRIFQERGITGHVQHFGARFSIIFGVQEEIVNYRQSLKHDIQMMLAFIREAAKVGLYFHDYGGKACHHGFSIAHQVSEIDEALNKMEDTCKLLKPKSKGVV